MIRQAHQVSIAGRTVFRALALAGAVTLVVTAGCGGGSSTSPTPDAATQQKYDVLPQSNQDVLSSQPDVVSAKDTWVPPVDTTVVTPQDVAPAVQLDTGHDTISADLPISPPDAPDANVTEVGGGDLPMLMAEVNGGVDSSATPIDGGSGGCPSAVHAWSYSVLELPTVVWDNDGTLLTGASFNGFSIPGSIVPSPTGTFGGISVTNKGSSDLLVAKLDASTGNANWVLTAGDGKDQYFGDLVSVGGTVATMGKFTGTLNIDPVNRKIPVITNPLGTTIDFLIGLKDSDGSGVWSESFDLGGGSLNRMAANPGKDYFLVCGSAMNDAADLGAVGTPGGGADVVVAAVKASDGSVIWAKLFGGAMDQKCLAAALDDSGNAYFAGIYAGSLDFGGGALPAGPTVVSGSNSGIAWVAKFKGADGTFLTAKSFGTTVKVMPSALSLDPQGALLMAGMYTADVTFGTQTLTKIGLADAFVAKLDSSTLAPVWARGLSEQPGFTVGASGVAADSAGNVTVVGRFQQTLAVGPGNTVLQAYTSGSGGETYVVTLSGASGATLCAKNYGDAASTSGSAPDGVAINSRATGAGKDRAVIFGQFTNVLNFGGATTPLSTGSSVLADKRGFLLEM